MSKANSPGQFRLIHNLAYPYNHNSVNQNIPDDQATVKYAPFDRAVEICLRLGQGCYIAREDFSAAFRLFPISYQDLELLGFTLDNDFYINSSMAFGSRSSCRIFEVFSTSVEWAAKRITRTCCITHYLDDFFLAHTTYVGCAQLMTKFQEITDFIGAPLAEEKREGPTQHMTFLGMDIDTVEQTIAIPAEKMRQALIMIEEMLKSPKRKTTVKAVQKLAGKLQYVTKGIPAGRPFLRRLYSLLQKATPTGERNIAAKPNPAHHIRVTNAVAKDLKTWVTFLTSETLESDRQVPFVRQLGQVDGPQLITDSAGSEKLGYGCIFRSRYMYARWPLGFFRQRKPSIALLELFAVVIAVDCWAPIMATSIVKVRSDNQAVISAITKGSSKCKWCLSLIRHLTLTCMRFQIYLVAQYLEGSSNQHADSLSRLDIPRFNRLRQKYFNTTGFHLLLHPDRIQSPLWPITWAKLNK